MTVTHQLGVSKNTPPEVVAELRREKARQAALVSEKHRQQCLRLADHVEQHPDSLLLAKAHVERFLVSPAHRGIHWILRRWQQVLADAAPEEVAAILRDDSESTRELRESPPYFGKPQPSRFP